MCCLLKWCNCTSVLSVIVQTSGVNRNHCFCSHERWRSCTGIQDFSVFRNIDHLLVHLGIKLQRLQLQSSTSEKCCPIVGRSQDQIPTMQSVAVSQENKILHSLWVGGLTYSLTCKSQWHYPAVGICELMCVEERRSKCVRLPCDVVQNWQSLVSDRKHIFAPPSPVGSW